jgi:two-component system, NtrC family, sensor kinase
VNMEWTMQTNYQSNETCTTGSKCILLVNDEKDILNLLKDPLTSHGYTCIFATNAEDALEIIQQVQVDLVISDVVMPGMSGTQLMEKIATYWPQVSRILITAYAEQESVVQAINKGHIQAYIKKPWGSDEVIQIVDSTISGNNKAIYDKPIFREFSGQPQTAEDRIDCYSDACSEINQEMDDLIRLTKKQHKSAEKLFNAITLCSQNVVIMLGHDHRITYWNHAAQELFGYPAEQVLGENLGLILAQDQNYHSILDELTTSHIKNENITSNRNYELAGRHCIGTVFPIKLAASAFQYNNDWHIVCSIQDITENKIAEASLRASEEMFYNVVEQNNLGILALDKQKRCIFANMAAEEITGRPSSKLLGEKLGYPLNINDSTEVNITRYDGSHRIVEMNTSKTIWKGCFAYLMVLHDITQRKEIERKAKIQEERLQQIQKLESIGQLAAGIAHEINTPTQFIGDNTHFLYNSFKDIEQIFTAYDQLVTAISDGNKSDIAISDVKHLAEDIDLEYLRNEIPKCILQSREGVERISSIVRAMKNFSHPGKSEKELIDINAAIENTITVSRNEWKYDAELTTDFDYELQHIPCLAGEFNQAILNMIVNAAHAIKEAKKADTAKNGVIHIKTRKSGNWATISICDNGTGIPDELRARIFDPFFTTKDVGIGTGQGLAITYATIIERHAGNIEVESEIGQGTTFTIWLPINDQIETSTNECSSLHLSPSAIHL